MLATLREKLANLIAPEVVERRNYFERLANTDALTGLANRTAFERASASADADPDMCFVIFDFNNFGKVNKTAGHAAGDKILIDYAAIMQNAARAFGGRVFRIGGDEFVVIVHGFFAARVRDAVERRCLAVDFGEFKVSVSGETGATLQGADARLQARKATRKGV